MRREAGQEGRRKRGEEEDEEEDEGGSEVRERPLWFDLEEVGEGERERRRKIQTSLIIFREQNTGPFPALPPSLPPSLPYLVPPPPPPAHPALLSHQHPTPMPPSTVSKPPPYEQIGPPSFPPSLPHPSHHRQHIQHSLYISPIGQRHPPNSQNLHFTGREGGREGGQGRSRCSRSQAIII